MPTTERDRRRDPATHWSAEELDLDAYLHRVGHTAPVDATLVTLRALHRAHATTIPFENVDSVLGTPVPIDIPSVQRKLVTSPRGGYCYEHNLLFAAVLERCGFRPRGLAGRTRMGSRALRPASHAALLVEIKGEAWLADVGFGGEGLLEPLPLRDGVESRQGDWTFRLDREDNGWLVRSRHPEGWFDLYWFTLDPRYRVDYEIVNHYVSTHPRSPFVRRVVVQQTRDSSRIALTGREFVVTRPGLEPVRCIVPPEEVPCLLDDEFGIALDDERRRGLVDVARRSE